LGLASAVLNGRHVRARPETVERIREAAQRLGYVPDRMAQAMRWGRTGIIALVVPNFANPYYSALAVEVQRAAWEADLEVLVYANPTEDLAQVSRAVSARRVDGGIIVVSHYTPEELKAHLPLEIPWVGVGHALEPLPFDRVSFKDKEAAMDAVRYLADKGYRRIAHLAGPAPSPTAKARLEGYLEAVSALGMPALVQEELSATGTTKGPSKPCLAGGPTPFSPETTSWPSRPSPSCRTEGFRYPRGWPWWVLTAFPWGSGCVPSSPP